MDTTKPQATPEQPKHETRDVNLRLIVISVVGLTILIILSLVVVQGLFGFLARQEASQAVPLRLDDRQDLADYQLRYANGYTE